MSYFQWWFLCARQLVGEHACNWAIWNWWKAGQNPCHMIIHDSNFQHNQRQKPLFVSCPSERDGTDCNNNQRPVFLCSKRGFGLGSFCDSLSEENQRSWIRASSSQYVLTRVENLPIGPNLRWFRTERSTTKTINSFIHPRTFCSLTRDSIHSTNLSM